jgi:ribonuclease Z
MRITFLGTSSGAPSMARNVSALVLRLPNSSTLWLFDCGEGTQHQAMRARLRLGHLERIFITHMHGDHVFGLPGLLASRSLQVSANSPVVVYGPSGLEDLVRSTLLTTETTLSYPLEFVTVHEGQVFRGGSVTVTAAPASHRIEAWAYAVDEDDSPGRLDVRRAMAAGVPFGPLLGRLKAGERVTLCDGSEVSGNELLGPSTPGRRVVYTGDTRYCDSIVALANGADLLIHEATYVADDGGLAERAAHSTSAIAAEVAKRAGVQKLALTHFSARYESSAGTRMAEMLGEATRVFPNTILAEDLLTVEIRRRAPDED